MRSLILPHLLLLSLLLLPTHSLPQSSPSPAFPRSPSSNPSPPSRPFPNGPHPRHDDHHHTGPVASVLNETAIEYWHGKTPLSYLYYDWVLTPQEVLDASWEWSGLPEGMRGRGSELRGRHEGHGEEMEEEEEEPGDGDAVTADRPIIQPTHSHQPKPTPPPSRLRGPGDHLPHPHLMTAHVILLTIGYVFLLPLSLALRAARVKPGLGRGRPPVVGLVVEAGLWVALVAGWGCGRVYMAWMPDLYEGNIHRSFGAAMLSISILLTSTDLILALLPSPKRAHRPPTHRQSILHTRLAPLFTLHATLRKVQPEEQVQLMHEAGAGQGWDEVEVVELQSPVGSAGGESRWSTTSERTLGGHGSPSSSESSHAGRKPERHDSTDSTSFDKTGGDKGLTRWGYVETFGRRMMLLLAYVAWLMGAVVYTGMGRGTYLPGLLAHFIKGSIFFWYGLITFGRYLGAWAEYGWAWNLPPSSTRVPSAEFVENLIIFLYGISNTFLERIGAAPGSAYTVKQVQHISIAVMFAGAGLVGMGMEVKGVSGLLGAEVGEEMRRRRGGSMNPFPAIVIGVLGIAMSAHHQDYEFQVSIHALWGYLLALYSIFRLLTYFFLFIAPSSHTSRSPFPTHPPTEALSSICVAAGGIVFVLSDEEIMFAAIRHGWDDLMAFLNLTFALVLFIFAWILIVMAVKGWAIKSTRMAEMGVSLYADGERSEE